VKNYL